MGFVGLNPLYVLCGDVKDFQEPGLKNEVAKPIKIVTGHVKHPKLIFREFLFPWIPARHDFHPVSVQFIVYAGTLIFDPFLNSPLPVLSKTETVGFIDKEIESLVPTPPWSQ